MLLVWWDGSSEISVFLFASPHPIPTSSFRHESSFVFNGLDVWQGNWPQERRSSVFLWATFSESMLVSISVFKHVVESSLGTASIFCCPEGEFCFFFSFLDFFKVFFFPIFLSSLPVIPHNLSSRTYSLKTSFLVLKFERRMYISLSWYLSD